MEARAPAGIRSCTRLSTQHLHLDVQCALNSSPRTTTRPPPTCGLGPASPPPVRVPHPTGSSRQRPGSCPPPPPTLSILSSVRLPAPLPLPSPGAIHSCHLTQVLLSLQGTLALTPRPCCLWLPLTSPLEHCAPGSPHQCPSLEPSTRPRVSQHTLPPRPAHPSTCWPLARAAGLLSSRPLSYSSGHSDPPSHLGLQ